MKLESTNIVIKANEDMNVASIKIKESKHEPIFLSHALLEEVRDLLNDYFEQIN